MKKLIVLLFVFVVIVANSATYYLSPTGNDTTGNGSIGSPWFTLNKVWAVVSAGDTIYLRGGTYKYSTRQTLSNKSGSSGNYIHVFNYPGESPVINPTVGFTDMYGIRVDNCDYLHMKGLDISNYIQRSSTDFNWGIIAIDVNNCIFELLKVHNNGVGLTLRPSNGTVTNNLILNSDFYRNYDPLTDFSGNTPYGGSDGLSIRVDDPNSTNTVRGCRIYRNGDDGFDGWGTSGYILFDNCWFFHNGYREDGVTTGGDGQGLKLGPLVPSPYSGYEEVLKRTVKNCLLFSNRSRGIDQNSTLAIMKFYNNTIYNNGTNGLALHEGSAIVSYFSNNIEYNNSDPSYFTPFSILETNTFILNEDTPARGIANPVFSVTNNDFITLDSTGVSGPRQPDGSLPDINFLKLKEDSKLIDAGVDVGIPYTGKAPDLGAFEYQKKNTENNPVHTTEDVSICSGSSYKGWTIPGQYQQILISASGADSIVTTNLTINPAIHVSEEIVISAGENYQGWTKTGIYERRITSPNGCDSIITTYLTVLQTINTEEEIIICEGESYHGWVTSGQFQRILKTVDGADSIVTTQLAVIPAIQVSEEVEITTGENYQGWTESGIYERKFTSATGCDSMVTTHLTVLDNKFTEEEITICEGDSYHGWSNSGRYQRILKTIEGADSIVTTQLTVNPVFQVSEEVEIWEGENYEGWTTSGQYERYFSSATGCDSIIVTTLKVEPLQNQLIDLTEGWNVFSSYLTPIKKSFDNVFENLKTNNLLMEVQNEIGKTYGNYDNKWINEIGELQESEGYRIRVDSAGVLEILGGSIQLPLKIELQRGLNIISFPYSEEADAMKMIQPLIDEGILEKVQDEKGNSIENWGNSMGWINGIGNFIPGEGYLVEVNRDGVLSLPEEFEKSGLILSDQPETIHFKKIFEGNGFGHMNINVTGLDVLNLKAGDEIGAFDGNLCVGAVRLTETNVSNNIASLQASASDKDLLNGFNEGNYVHLRVWLNSTELEFQVQPEVMKGNNLYQKHGSVFLNLLENKMIESTEHSLMGVNVFPNPANEKITIQFSFLPESEIKIIFTDMTGKLITARIVNSITEYLHVDSLPSGIYFLKIFQKDYAVIKKLMIN